MESHVHCHLRPNVFCGLTTTSEFVQLQRSLPLISVVAGAEIRGLAVAIVAKLTYENDTDQPVDCQFILPVRDLRTIFSFEVDETNNFNKLFGKCRPTSNYQNAKRSSVLGTGDVSRIRLGVLDAHSTVTIRLGFINQLQRQIEDGAFVFKLPSVLTPYVVSHAQLRKIAATKIVAISEKRYDFRFKANVSLGSQVRIASIKTLSDDDGGSDFAGFISNQQFATFERKSFTCDREFGLRIYPLEPCPELFIYVEPGRRPSYDKSLYINDNSLLDLDIAMVFYCPNKGDQNSMVKDAVIDWKFEDPEISVKAKVPKGLPSSISAMKCPVFQMVYLARPELSNVVFGRVKFTASFNDRAVSIGKEFQISKQHDDDAIMALHRLAFKLQIDAWEGAVQRAGGSDSTLRDSLVKLSLRTGIVSSQTCLVAVDSNGFEQEVIIARSVREVMLFENPRNEPVSAQPRQSFGRRLASLSPSTENIEEESTSLPRLAYHPKPSGALVRPTRDYAGEDGGKMAKLVIRQDKHDGSWEPDSKFLSEIVDFMHPVYRGLTPENFLHYVNACLTRHRIVLDVKRGKDAATWVMLTLLRLGFVFLPKQWQDASQKAEAYLKSVYVPKMSKTQQGYEDLQMFTEFINHVVAALGNYFH